MKITIESDKLPDSLRRTVSYSAPHDSHNASELVEIFAGMLVAFGYMEKSVNEAILEYGEERCEKS